MSFDQWFPIIAFGGPVFVGVFIFSGSAFHNAMLQGLTERTVHSMNTHSQYEYYRAIAAKWIYANRFGASWMTWPVITKANLDPTNPQVPEIMAQNIFTELEYRQLMVPNYEHGVQVGYKLNLSKEAEWRDLSVIPSRYKRMMSWIGKHLGQFLFWIITVIITTTLSSYINYVIMTWPVDRQVKATK